MNDFWILTREYELAMEQPEEEPHSEGMEDEDILPPADEAEDAQEDGLYTRYRR